jgi:23S rRNA (cytosine1962-C5)-methyltransferase
LARHAGARDRAHDRPDRHLGTLGQRARTLEGLTARTGGVAGAEPPETIEIKEGGCRFLVDVRRGHKTGFYLDQRDARAALARHAADAEVLNAFAYTGGFAVAALRAGARQVTNVDSSLVALELAARNVALNGIDAGRVEQVEGDVFSVLRQYRDAGRQFDVVLLDPPRFAASRTQVEGAARGYKDINLLGFKLLRPGGTLHTFSCSGHVDASLFRKIVAGAALDAGRDARVVERLGQPADHPVALAFPEGEYLKGLICRVD